MWPVHAGTPGPEAGLGSARPFPGARDGGTGLVRGGSAGPGRARGIAPGGLGGGGPGVPAAPGPWQPPLQAAAPRSLVQIPTSQTSLSGGRGAPRASASAADAQRLSCPHKGARRPAPGPLNLPPLPKVKLPSPRSGRPAAAARGETSRFRPAPRSRAACQAQRRGGSPAHPGRPAEPGWGHSPDFWTCGGIVLAMRVHRTMCSGHRPLSSPRPMAAPAARHRPSPERSGRRLPGPLAAPPPRVPAGRRARPAGQMCGPDVAPGGRRGGGLEAGEARGGPRRPRGAAQEAGSCSRPGRVRARGCRRSGRASDSLNFTRRCGGKQETPRQQLGRTSRCP